MTTLTAWAADEPCPGCGTTLTLDDDGGGSLRIECRSCGHADTWTCADPGARDAEHRGWR